MICLLEELMIGVFCWIIVKKQMSQNYRVVFSIIP